MPVNRKSPTSAEASDGLQASEVHAAAVGWREFRYTAPDGLSLFARDYGDPLSPWLPVVCLSGLARSSTDFHALATHLAQHRHRPRRVVAFDYRGRGRSDWDPNPAGYNPLTELADIRAGLAALGIARAVVVGTSRGGIIGMLMALATPMTVAGLVLNDVGPALTPLGLARIKSYVGRMPAPDSWDDAAQILRRLHGAGFTGWNDTDWDYFARLTYRDSGGRPVSDYDPALSQALAGIELDEPIPDMWKEFRALKETSMMVIRGGNSDLLSLDTVTRMAAEHPGLEVITVHGEGHAPVLRRASILTRVSAFITAREGNAPAPETIVPQPLPTYDLDTPRS